MASKKTLRSIIEGMSATQHERDRSIIRLMEENSYLHQRNKELETQLACQVRVVDTQKDTIRGEWRPTYIEWQHNAKQGEGYRDWVDRMRIEKGAEPSRESTTGPYDEAIEALNGRIDEVIRRVEAKLADLYAGTNKHDTFRKNVDENFDKLWMRVDNIAEVMDRGVTRHDKQIAELTTSVNRLANGQHPDDVPFPEPSVRKPVEHKPSTRPVGRPATRKGAK